jgi:hypothetical protein
MTKNIFTNNLAQEGGAIYIQNPPFASQPTIFDSQVCSSNYATTIGGCIYYKET